MEFPTWLNKDLMRAVLQGKEKDGSKITVIQISVEQAVPPGNNFTSIIYRTRVEYMSNAEEKSSVFIIKTPITTGSVGEMLKDVDLFNKEPTVYHELLPMLADFTNSQFGPKSFPTSVKNALVMEDLKEKGYSLCDRYKQLDFSHCELVLKTLANFHAASVAIRKHKPDLIEKVGKEVIYIEGPMFDQKMKHWVTGGLSIVAGIIKQLGVSKDIEKLFSSLVDTSAEVMVKLCKPRSSGLNVLNHGDLWNSNILFKYNEAGDVVDLKFIDYQACKYGSPVMDLIYFLWTSANNDVREERLLELCEIYRVALNLKLEELSCEERLTADELHEHFRDAKVWVLVTISTVLPVQMSDPQFHETMQSGETNMAGNEMEMFSKLYEGKQYMSLLPNLVKQIQTWVSYYK